MKHTVALSWSGGKDAAMALHEIRQNRAYDIVLLLTSVTDSYDRISMHGVRERLLDEQAAALDLPLTKIRIPVKCSNRQYRSRMQQACERLKTAGISHIAFGDLFLQDVREYREKNVSKVGLKALFPLWQRNTHRLADRFIRLGFKAVVVCVDSQKLDRAFAGRPFDKRFLRDLPHSVDSCGENGEFHSFVYDGPVFGRSVAFNVGPVILRERRFWFCDLLPPPGA
jgi:uncharacterized protein (TIGR00290 family)